MAIRPTKLYGYYAVSADDYDEYLAHYGVKGMKWGVHKKPERGELGSRKTTWKPDDKRAWKMDIDTKKKIVKGLGTAGIGVAVSLATPGVAIFAIAGGLGGAAQATAQFAMNRRRDTKYEKQRDDSPVDPKTGLHLKTREYSKDEDMDAVNPMRFGTIEGSSYNCSLCSAAYDMRRRGYDVAANFTSEGTSARIWEKWYKNAKVSPEQSLRGEDKQQKVRAFRDALIKQGDGARGTVSVMYEGGSGHSVAYDIEGGKLIIRDCQGNEKYVMDDAMVDKYFKHVDVADYTRLDNLRPNLKEMRSALR